MLYCISVIILHYINDILFYNNNILYYIITILYNFINILYLLYYNADSAIASKCFPSKYEYNNQVSCHAAS